ncbi:15810_t:CDS:2 [Racocetra persica]|uniref:15810_t:CDS:1 n=1 Tax=Racocetra persica TaxID=160502 RepID=A0ACA9RN12_9GLOM|nr:15810_t:CDS:2 [Racocetra persica]
MQLQNHRSLLESLFLEHHYWSFIIELSSGLLLEFLLGLSSRFSLGLLPEY